MTFSRERPALARPRRPADRVRLRRLPSCSKAVQVRLRSSAEFRSSKTGNVSNLGPGAWPAGRRRGRRRALDSPHRGRGRFLAREGRKRIAIVANTIGSHPLLWARPVDFNRDSGLPKRIRELYARYAGVRSMGEGAGTENRWGRDGLRPTGAVGEPDRPVFFAIENQGSGSPRRA